MAAAAVVVPTVPRAHRAPWEVQAALDSLGAVAQILMAPAAAAVIQQERPAEAHLQTLLTAQRAPVAVVRL